MNPSRRRHTPLLKSLFIILAAIFLFSGTTAIWAITLPVPDIDNYFQQISKGDTTKIYDRTGKVLLYNLSGIYRRTEVPLNQISQYVKDGSIAIEDEEFYNHNGIRPTAILRALFVDTMTGSKKQGASTITQQVIKNTVLSAEKTWTRKIKEAILAIKLERSMSKDQILELYLNEIPYGGNIYGIEEAANTFFDKKAADLNLVESAYLAAIPQAPTTYSPYGSHLDLLEARKNLVLDKMATLGYITKDEALKAKTEKATFAPASTRGLNAPHFVFFVKDYLEQKYGDAASVEKMGLKVYTTLDFSLQEKAETIVKKYAEENDAKYKASNAAMVAIDPKTGQILAMVGSRDYFDIAHEGNFNVATAHRQPGSSFKPFVYATAFNMGYTPDTVLFDLPTEFNPSCPADSEKNKTAECYMPVNYDGKYEGPLTLRNALAQSRNIPAVKLLYLVGVDNALTTARNFGITGLKDKNTYGLTLVLGGGEVSLLEMTNAYGVFANDGVYHPYTGILKVVDKTGKTLEEYQEQGQQVIANDSARKVSSILSDNTARIPAYGANSPLYFPGRDVAAKTGTTNDYRDTWILGYSPNLVVGAWAGNNNNSPIDKKVAGFVVAPMWGEFMRQVLPSLPNEKFIAPDPTDQNLKPILRGIWQDGGQGIHSILYWINKNNPLGPAPFNPRSDQQFNNWEYAIQKWLSTQNSNSTILPPTTDNGFIPSSSPLMVVITSPISNTTFKNTDDITVRLNIKGGSYPVAKTEFYLNQNIIKTAKNNFTSLTFGLAELTGVKDKNELKVIVYDQKGTQVQDVVNFSVTTASSTPTD